MNPVLDHIRAAVEEGRFVVSVHADDMLRERGILVWQVVADISQSRVLRTRTDDKPNPIVELEQLLPDGTPVKVVWAWFRAGRFAKLVTVHFFDH